MDEWGPPDGRAYNESGAEKAWGRMLELFKAELWQAAIPFVSSEVETPIDPVPSPMGISTSLDANGCGRASMRVRAAARGVARIDALAAGAEGHDLIGFAVVAMLHPGRSRRHPGDGEAFDALRLFAAQARDFLGGNMPLDHIAAEENGVAAAQRSEEPRLNSSH